MSLRCPLRNTLPHFPGADLLEDLVIVDSLTGEADLSVAPPQWDTGDRRRGVE